ncbi:MAG: glutamine synthetase III [Oscillospiraceae bacterium]|jgi:glutamine synthetase|nr:glutamine synthetase III [Oscillospiraceae bacterium]
MANIQEIFGSKVFNEEVWAQKLPKPVYKSLKMTIDEGQPISKEVANAVAHAMKEWAIEQGCTHYTHWFQPMTGITAEKHDSFINIGKDGKAILEFSGKELIKGEPDASSFPSGGIRATFEARGYTAWDPTSYAFAKDGTLYIPTAFCSYTGEVLDKKTPLLRSMERLSDEAVKVLHLLGKTDVKKVATTVGAEQEYFLVDKEQYEKRKDLIFAGRTLFGAKAPKGQELEDHYFGTIKPRIAKFMAEVDEELWKLGVFAKTKHNEVAPAQHELAPIFATANLAVDQNQLTMIILKQVAERHGLVCLLHEKPFAGINGSGKHNNWSISTNTGENLLSPGKKPYENVQFLLFLAAVLKAVDDYQDLLRLAVASAGNDHRLGANEAPPAIISAFIGAELGAVVESIINETDFVSEGRKTFELGAAVLPEFRKDTTDRNRTSPFAFTGNKFEFRMLGSALNIACPNIMLNTTVAESLAQFAAKLEGADDVIKAAKAIIKEELTAHQRIIFNGNNYAAEWVTEAESRGLLNMRTSPEAFVCYTADKNVALFEKHKIFTKEELAAREEILLENYNKSLNIEALTMLDMAKKDILPAVFSYIGKITKTTAAVKALGDNINVDTQLSLIETFSKLLACLSKKIDTLDAALVDAAQYEDDSKALANFYVSTIIPAMGELRAVADELEINTAAKYWPMPSYGDLLFRI